MEKELQFPKGFLWGSSTSAYQVEGGIEDCDWSEKYPAGRACDHYNRYEQDFDWLEKLNQNVFRFSIEWSRIEPEPGKFDLKEIDHYKKVLLALKKRNIKTIVTLWHWTNPKWFMEKGGWADKKSVRYFENYTRVIVQEIGDLVDFWITLNEPMVYIGGYSIGKFPPFKKRNILKLFKVFDNLSKANQKSYNLIHQKYPEAKVGTANLINYFEPARRWCPIETLLAKIFHYLWNNWFLNKIKDEIDFLGLDYYFHNRIVWYPFLFSTAAGVKVPFVKNLNKKTTDLGWEVYPEGIYHVLKYLAKFKKPIYITENGLADSQDKYRKEFIKDHLIWVHKVIQEGADVRGYLYWSLMDNLEWHGGTKKFEQRFGLLEIDYNTLERKPRSSAYYYAEICKNNYLKIKN